MVFAPRNKEETKCTVYYSKQRRKSKKNLTYARRLKVSSVKKKYNSSVILDYVGYVSLVISASCLVYIVQWLEALRKGWLV